MSINDQLVTRNVTVIDLSNPHKIKLPEVFQTRSCVIHLENRYVDIGSACYAIRSVNKIGRARAEKDAQGIWVVPVQLDSFEKSRTSLIKKVIEFTAYRIAKDSQRTVSNRLRYILSFLQFYFSQTDLAFSDPENQTHYEEAARRYSAFVLADAKQGGASKLKLTAEVYTFAEYLFDDATLNAFDYNIIPDNSQEAAKTNALLQDEADIALGLRTAIFEAICDLLLNNKALPYPLKVPTTCGELNDTIWLGYKPWQGPTSFPRQRDFEKRKPQEWFERETGELLTRDQWFALDNGFTRRRKKSSWNQISGYLNQANALRSGLKLRLAGYATLCFFDLLLDMTAANNQPTLDLPWFGGYVTQKTQAGKKSITLLSLEDQKAAEEADDITTYLHAIKNRKGYRPVGFQIDNKLLPRFKRYVQLRGYVLNGEKSNQLFPLPKRQFETLRSSLNATFPEVPKWTPRIARATASEEILGNHPNPEVAARILQNDPKTIIKHYAAGTQAGHIEGMGGFFNAVGDQIKLRRKSSKNEVETATGSCKSGGTHPEALSDTSIVPNCTQPEGCFFCKHFTVHTDEIDVRKLLSVLFYIQTSATCAQSIDFFNDIFGAVVNRIQSLLDQIAGLSNEKNKLVAQIRHEVFEEELLDDYWLNKLKRLDWLTEGG